MKKHYFAKNICLPGRILALIGLILTLLFSKAYSQNVPGLNEAERIARSLLNKVDSCGNYITNVINSTLEFGKLPIGQVREINGQRYVIAIANARVTNDNKAFINAYFRFTIPGTTEELIFGANDIAFHSGGMGLSNNTRLVLLNNKSIPINQHVALTLPGGGDNYIEWNCEGFKSVHLRGDFEFDSDWIKPAAEGQDKVRASVEISISDITNILASVSMPAFKIKGLTDFSFSVSNAVVDMSDIANPQNLLVTGDMMPVPGNPLSWRGFYLEELEVGLPSQLSTAHGRPKVSVRNFYIDDQGVSGVVTASNVVTFGDASVGGWPISITQLSLNFSKSRLNGGGFEGLVGIGFLGDEPLSYSATVNMRNEDTYYDFSMVTNGDKTYQFFAGEITVGQNSRIAVTKNQDGFLASATLNGNVSLKKGVIDIAQIKYQNLRLSTRSPYVHSGTFDFVGNKNGKMANFPIGIDNLTLGFSEGKVGIGGTVRLNFMNSSDRGFAASTSFMVTASRRDETQTIRVNEVEVQQTTSHWGLDKVTLSAISLDVKVAAFTMKGSLTLFENHAVYGNGFKGSLSFAIPGPVPSASATAYFGSKDDYRYWHVDAYVAAKFPLCAALDVTGLMGGLTYRMKKPPLLDYYQARQEADTNGGLNRVVEANERFAYIPDKDSGYGFMAGVSVATKVEKVLNANVLLEIELSASGGLRTIEFKGSGYVMNTPKKAASKAAAAEDSSAPIWVNFRMLYSRPDSTFDAVIKTYVDVSGVLKGKGERGLAGEAALHIAPREWYFYIGRPSQMFGLSALGLAEINAYFMMGSSIEDMPPPPPEVSEVLGRRASTTSTAKTGMQAGSGLGFGAHFRVGFSFDYGVYGEFAVGAGADILLRNYGENARCKGGSGSIGVNGWYASGQAYAFLRGEVGIRAKIFGRKRSFVIASLAAAALLEAKLPNPSWFMGQVGVRYSVLGGLVSGSANIKVELGTKCEIVGGREINIQVISDIKPDNNSQDVSVFATPQVTFNMPVEKPFEMLNNEDRVARYRIKLSQFTLKDDKNVPLLGTMTVNADGSAASITTRDILPPTTKLTAFAGIAIEKQEGNNWVALSGTAEDYETKSTVFTTGEAPNYIPWENVVYTYPIKRQYNFLPKEYGQGYIKLSRGQPYLFRTTDDKGKKWATRASFTPVAGVPVASPVSYDENNVQVNFTIPENLTKETIYTFTIKRISLDGEKANNNVVASEKTTYTPSDTTTIRETSLKGVAASGLEKEIIAIPLRTSTYGTFREKMEGVTGVQDLWDVSLNYSTVIGQRFSTRETFDKFELNGDNLMAKPLIQLKAGTNCSWLQNKLMPFLYNDYPQDPSVSLTHSRPEIRKDGVAPLYAVTLFNNNNENYALEDSKISEGHSSGFSGSCRFVYYLELEADRDYFIVYNQIANRHTRNHSNAAMVRILTEKFPILQLKQKYPVEFQYRLPGTNLISSTVVREINYE